MTMMVDVTTSRRLMGIAKCTSARKDEPDSPVFNSRTLKGEAYLGHFGRLVGEDWALSSGVTVSATTGFNYIRPANAVVQVPGTLTANGKPLTIAGVKANICGYGIHSNGLVEPARASVLSLATSDVEQMIRSDGQADFFFTGKRYTVFPNGNAIEWSENDQSASCYGGTPIADLTYREQPDGHATLVSKEGGTERVIANFTPPLPLRYYVTSQAKSTWPTAKAMRSDPFEDIPKGQFVGFDGDTIYVKGYTRSLNRNCDADGWRIDTDGKSMSALTICIGGQIPNIWRRHTVTVYPDRVETNTETRSYRGYEGGGKGSYPMTVAPGQERQAGLEVIASLIGFPGRCLTSPAPAPANEPEAVAAGSQSTAQ